MGLFNKKKGDRCSGCRKVKEGVHICAIPVPGEKHTVSGWLCGECERKLGAKSWFGSHTGGNR